MFRLSHSKALLQFQLKDVINTGPNLHLVLGQDQAEIIKLTASARLWLIGGVILFARCRWIQLTNILKPSKYYSACCSMVG